MSIEAAGRTLEKPREPGHRKSRLKSAERYIFSLRREPVILHSPRNHPPYYGDYVRNIMRDGRHFPIVLGTHKSHPGGFPPMEEAVDIKNIANSVLPHDQQIKGSRFLFASSLDTEEQDEEVVTYFKLAQPTLVKLGVKPLYVVREKEARNGTPRNREEQYNALMHTVEEGLIPIVLPEGSVESGRQKPGGRPGEIKGMIELEQNGIRMLVRYMQRQGKIPVLFFVGVTGENHIYNPITKKITGEAKRKAFWLKRSSIMRAVIDYPTSVEDILPFLEENGQLPRGALEQYCGERLAQLLPLNERGVYAEPELLGCVPVLRRDTTHLFKAAYFSSWNLDSKGSF
ncbi:MAG: hypothetical protein A3C27_01930 [Candidatus Levybacteria bacterium RIFCSPHIGHO2_02_FULL_39_36]|nr:MAG: hypothetical protein UT56_C0014G0011 [Candidatus Levybacteria bacterium GW2011_GWB1_39_7]OGH25777.1 MAG: hypothetical protein A3E68_01260 [Candidatus Levybacteria bacterium RIFCSPHIGHO2_12_FULL_39_39]OGH27465.1 MAG: hypothetical protein A3C27_01930 [Candidatus Levybacteria bacterium RIFCSPHIGHO2_02_FULL_39_36]OGH45417.1 MAG: hypothetical protein A3H82_02935 [Candidatus Levybacteria bacterium RIFCSPLOWO2_02_FULL_39_26]OGH47003.1 MAG: hypothetical protein A3G66_04490 [Candidatus Levybacte